jgi:hypothetical protein
MKFVECELESEVLAEVLQSRWPGLVEAALRDHVATCPVCSEAVAVACALQHEANELRASAVLPNAGRVWWEAELRARREAAQIASGPITAVQVIVLAAIIGLLGASLRTIYSWFESSVSRIGAGLVGFDDRGLLSSAAALIAQHSAVAITVAALILVVPTAVLFAVARD